MYGKQYKWLMIKVTIDVILVDGKQCITIEEEKNNLGGNRNGNHI